MSFLAKPTPPNVIDTLSLHDALPIFRGWSSRRCGGWATVYWRLRLVEGPTPRREAPARDFVWVRVSCPCLRKAPNEADGCKGTRSEEHTSELQSPDHLVCRLLLENKK